MLLSIGSTTSLCPFFPFFAHIYNREKIVYFIRVPIFLFYTRIAHYLERLQ